MDDSIMTRITKEERVSNRRKRLQQWIDARYEGRQAPFIEFIDINQGELSGLLSKKSFGEDKARDIEDKAGMPYLWLDKLDSEDCEFDIFPSQGFGKPLSNDYIQIEQHNDVSGSMGGGQALSEQAGQITGWQVTKEWVNKNVPAHTGVDNLRIVTGFGDSMKGMFNSGDPLLVDIGVTDLKYDGVYFFRVGDEGFIKRLQRIPGNGVIVISNNSEYRDWTITKDMSFEIFGRVLKVWEGSEF